MVKGGKGKCTIPIILRSVIPNSNMLHVVPKHSMQYNFVLESAVIMQQYEHTTNSATPPKTTTSPTNKSTPRHQRKKKERYFEDTTVVCYKRCCSTERIRIQLGEHRLF